MLRDLIIELKYTLLQHCTNLKLFFSFHLVLEATFPYFVELRLILQQQSLK